MKYLKLYENSFNRFKHNYSYHETSLNLGKHGLTNLDGIEKFQNLNRLYINNNDIKSLKPLRALKGLTYLILHDTLVESFEGLENSPNIDGIGATRCRLTSLKGIENCTKLRQISIRNNYLTNLDELEGFNLLENLYCTGNPFETPIPYSILRNITNLEDVYDYKIIEKFTKYDFQKNFIEEHPENILDLKPIGINARIKEEYKDLLSFFNI